MVLPGFPGKIKNVKSVSKYGHLIMRFQQWGCKNRPFYHIVVDKVKHHWCLSLRYHQQPFFQESVPNRRQIGYVEQVGTYDMMTNSNNEKLISLNLERIQTYIAGGVQVSTFRVGTALSLGLRLWIDSKKESNPIIKIKLC